MATGPEETAQEAGLRYVTDARPGIRRTRSDGGFRYLRPDGSRVTHRSQVAWITSLAIPPAWTDVWICPDRRGHLQATGRDARGRKQYRYHPEWRVARDDTKYGRLLDFGRVLPRIRRRVRRDLARPGLPREKVLAVVVRLLEKTLLRVGNEEYARDNKSFGLTTLRGRHAEVGAGTIRFRFSGKSGKVSEVSVSDRRLARVIVRLQDLPGQELFQFIDVDGDPRSIGSEDVNAYLREITGDDFTAKDFRTWAGSVRAAWALRGFVEAEGDADAKRNVVRAIKEVAEELGNTPAVSRRAYVHPSVIEAYLDGGLVRDGRPASAKPADGHPALKVREAALMALLRSRRRPAAESSPSPRKPARRAAQGHTPQAASASKRSSARR